MSLDSRRLDRNAIDEVAAPDNCATVLDVVALPRSNSTPLPWGASAADGPGTFSTFGLGFRVGAHWTLRVPEEEVGTLLIGWGSPGAPGLVMLPPDCPTLRTREKCRTRMRTSLLAPPSVMPDDGYSVKSLVYQTTIPMAPPAKRT